MTQDFRFLYKTDKGVIPREKWMAGALPLLIVLGALTAVLREAMAYANRDLTQRAFIDPASIAFFAYVIFYAFALMLLCVCWVNLSAKRFRDRGRAAPLALAALAPFAAFLAGAVHWLQPRVAEIIPAWSLTLSNGALIGVLLWTLGEMFDLLPKSKADAGRRIGS